jgi:HSP20 family protein
MAQMNIHPLDLLDLLQEGENLWGWSRIPSTAGLFDRSVSPRIDLLEGKQDCTLWVDVPGLDKNDLELSITGNVLTVQGEKKASPPGKDKERVYRDETWSGRFQRTLSLPDTVDPATVSAEFHDGVLKVTIAKKAEHQPRLIPVAVH